MKEIILVYGDNCFGSKKALALIENILDDKKEILVHWIPFSFQNPLVKKYNVMITPTFIIDEKVAFVGTPEKEELLERIQV